MRLQFLGANRQVTGSRYLLEAGGLTLLIDCGLFQEREFQDRNWQPSPVSPESIDYVLLTHAHLDHCGLLPRLVAQGYQGPVLTTPPSVDLAQIIMLDAGRIQEEDARYKKKRHLREGRKPKHPQTPLYTAQDAQQAVPLLQGVKYKHPRPLNDHVTVTFHEAGHILGSAYLEIAVQEADRTRRLVFSGDLGQWDKPLINDPHVLECADYVVMESTYGDRSHKEAGPIDDQLAHIIHDTAQRGGNVVIPTFALERAQELVYYMGRLVKGRRIPDLPVYLDSPMAVDVTEVFHQHCQYLDEESRCRFEKDVSSLRFPNLHLVRRQQDSIAINGMRGPKVIMSSAGMCTGGRIKHHLRQNITRDDSTLLFVGYQAHGTLGRQIVDGRPQVRIHGRMWPVKAKIEQIHGFSAHGDRDDLLRWLNGCPQAPKRLFLTHGEEDAALTLAKTIEKQLHWPVHVPHYQESIELL